MNNIVTTIMTASLLTASFSIYAEDSSFDDGYHNEGFSSYDIPASSSPGKSFDVSLNEMYRNEGFTAYNQDIIDQHSIEGSVLSVAAVAAVK